MRTRGNKAMNDKDSILADTKNLLYILYPAIQRMPKIERIEGAPVMMKSACYGIIGHFSIAKECPEVRLDHIRAMFGEYGKLLAAFDLCIQFGFLTGGERLRIAIQLERIKEGVRKWRNAARSPKSEAPVEVAGIPGEPPASMNR